jgi:hypothetical protein
MRAQLLHPRGGRTIRAMYLLGAGIVLTAVLAACGGAYTGQLNDRSDPADLVGTVDYTAVYQNIQYFPNVALSCVDGLGFATTSTGRGESAGATPLVRVPERDAFCATKRPAAGVEPVPPVPSTLVPVPTTTAGAP